MSEQAQGMREQDEKPKHSPLPWRVVFSEVRHRKGSQHCQGTCGRGEIPARIEHDDNPQWPEESEIHVLVHEDFVKDIVDAKGEHAVCLGAHEYDDCGAVGATDAAFIVEAVNNYAALLAAKEALEQQVAHWKTCSLCGQRMEAPGYCSDGETEQVAGLKLMHEQTLERAEAAAQSLASLQQENQQLREQMRALGGQPRE